MRERNGEKWPQLLLPIGSPDIPFSNEDSAPCLIKYRLLHRAATSSHDSRRVSQPASQEVGGWNCTPHHLAHLKGSGREVSTSMQRMTEQ